MDPVGWMFDLLSFRERHGVWSKQDILVPNWVTVIGVGWARVDKGIHTHWHKLCVTTLM